MIALIVLVIQVILNFGQSDPINVTIIPPMPQESPAVIESHSEKCLCDDCCYREAVKEFEDEFTQLFNSYEIKRAKNGALMIRRGNSGPYKFARKK